MVQSVPLPRTQPNSWTRQGILPPRSREKGALMESEEERCPAGPAMPMSVAAVPEAQTKNLCYRCTVTMTFLQMLGTAFRPLAHHSHK